MSLDAALAMRDAATTNPELAIAALSAIASSDDEAWPAAAYELSILYLNHARPRDADTLLRQLGFRYRLADAVFAVSTKKGRAKKGKEKAGGALPLRVVDELLPAALLAELQLALGPESRFWEQHSYPTPCFFSYNFELPKEEALRKRKRQRQRAAAAAAEVPPGGALLAAVAALLLPHAERLLADSEDDADGGGADDERDDDARLGSVEWWAHSRKGAGAGHQLHFDLDEAALPDWQRRQEQRDEEDDDEDEEEEQESSFEEDGDAEESEYWCEEPPPHPDVSCVLYLDAASAAPTLVTDHDVDEGAEGTASRGWLCRPRLNRALLFRGGLLHGVVPAKSDGPAAEGGGAEAGGVRTTLMLGFWRAASRPRPGAAGGELPAPNMRAAFIGGPAGTQRGGRAVDWPSLFDSSFDAVAVAAAVSAAGEGSGDALALPADTVAVAPVWRELIPADDEENEQRAHGTEFVGRYFLQEHPDTLRETLLFPPDADAGAVAEGGGDGGGGGGAAVVEDMSLADLARLRGEYAAEEAGRRLLRT